ncbi:MAG: hypothetical protein JW809_09615 [Pirellulales bacterium]|nr:hypothetical protein [Pirellulales bacterium]
MEHAMPVGRGRRRRRVALLGAAWAGWFALVGLAAADGQTPYIVVGRQSDLFDQAYVEVELTRTNPDGSVTGIGPYDSGYGIYPYSRLLLDTGANAMLIVSDAAADLETNGYVTEGYYYEQGVAGYEELYVSARYNVHVTGTDGSSVVLPQSDAGQRILSNPDLHLGDYPASIGGFTGLIGMPAMIDRVTTLDFTGWFDVEDFLEMPPLGVNFPTVGGGDPTPLLPAGNGHRYTVAVDTRMTFDPRDGLLPDDPPDAPLPSWAPVPFLTAKVEYRDDSGVLRVVEGDFLLDTGAQMTMLSRDMAFALGLDADGDGTFQQENLGTLPIGGIGGTVEAELLLVDRVLLPTLEGVDLCWTPGDAGEEGAITVLVLPADATQLPFNILGMDLLTGGLEVTIDWVTFEVIVEGNPYFEQIQLDFRTLASEGAGNIYFDLNPEIDVVVTPGAPGDANNDGFVDDEDAAILAAHWLGAATDGALQGDFNNDFVVDDLDLAILAANWNPAGGAAVPEPGALVLLIAGLACVLPRRRPAAQ